MAIIAYIAYLLIACAAAAIYFIRSHFSYWKERGIPHLPASILYGNMIGVLNRRNFAQCFEEAYNKFKGTGPFCGFYFFQRKSVLLLDMPLIKNVLIKDFNNFTDRGTFYNEKDDPLTGHLFNLDGQRWSGLRKKLSSTFTSGKMKFMFPTVVQVADEFVKVFAENLEKNNIIEIKDLLARFTTDVIGSCAFGVECNSLRDPNAEFREMGRRIFTDRRHGRLVLGFMQGFPQLARKLGLRVTTDAVSDFFMRIVRETVDYRQKHNIKRNDFLNILIELGEGDSLSVAEMAAQVFVFFLAGFETSSTTMGFALYELAQAPQIQQRMREEVIKTLEKHNNEFTYECMNDMHYMEQVIAETLRKYTIVPVLTRQALKDYVVPDHPKYVIEKGVLVLIPASSIHLDPEYYAEPEKFDPERFTRENVQQRDSVEWLPFGDGPRNCIGLRFGKMQTRIGLAYLLKNFKFSVCAETQIPLQYDAKSFLLGSKDGIFLKVEKL